MSSAEGCVTPVGNCRSTLHWADNRRSGTSHDDSGGRASAVKRASLILVMAAVSLLALPSGSDAQPAKVPRVGFLLANSASDPQVQRSLDVFRQALRDLAMWRVRASQLNTGRRKERGQDPQGGEGRRPSRRAPDEIRTGCQPQDRQGAGTHAPAVGATTRRPGYRVISQLPEIALHLPLGLAFAPARAGEYGR